jgi:hypothetical protein
MEALKVVWELSIPKGITQDMLPYLIGLIQNEEDLEMRQELADRMSSFLTELLEVHFLYEYKADLKKPEPMKQAMGCFYVYWSVLSHLTTLSKDIISIYYGTGRFEKQVVLLKHFYSKTYLNLSNLRFSSPHYIVTENWSDFVHKGATFNGASLNNTNFADAYIHVGKLNNSLFVNCIFKNTDLSYSDLSYSNFSGSDFEGATLNEVILVKSNLNKCRNLTYPQLARAKTLHGCTGIPKDIEHELRLTHPHLFEKPEKE